MKKILALLMMFLISGNFVFAQTGTTATVQPKLNFQAVVREAENHLVFDNEMKVVINITYGSEVYSETHESVTTNQNGLLTVVIGGDDATEVQGSLYTVDWSIATIEAAITFTPNPTLNPDGTVTTYSETTVTVNSEVTAVPYALQTGSTKLNTDMIVDYISGMQFGTESDKYDVLKILDAIRFNTPLKNALKDTIVEYMKNRMDIAKEVFQYYLSHATAADVQNTYDEVVLNPEARAAILEVIKTFIKNHEPEAIDIAKYYAEHVTASDLVPLYHAFEANPALVAQAKALVKAHLREYLEDHYYVSTEDCPEVEICAIGNQGLTTCPTGFIGATTSETNSDGDVVLTSVINNPDNWNYQAKYTYVLEGETHTINVTKNSGNVTATIGSLPTGTQVKLTIHIYGHDECDLEPVVYTF